MYPWVASPAKLLATGWQPRHSNRDALAGMVEEHRRYVSLVGMRAERSTVRSVSMAAVGVVAVTAAREVRRRRQRRLRSAR